MSRIVTYITDPASKVSSDAGFLMFIEMLFRGFHGASVDARMMADYALFSPDEFPAGGCRQLEIDSGEENGIDTLAVMAEQITVSRESA